MKTRFLTGIGIAVIYTGMVLLSIYVHSIFYDILILIAMIMMGLEMCQAISKKFPRPIEVIVVLNIIFGYLAFYVVHHVLGSGSGGITSYFAVLTIMFIVCIVYNMFSKTKTIKNVISTMLVLVYPTSIMVYMLSLNYLADPYRIAAILMLVLCSSFTDTFAYFVGSTIKGPKLCPKISPKKTISGAIGGVLGGLLAGGVVLMFSLFGWFNVAPISSHFGMNILHFLLIGGLGSISVQLGDLIASYIKRASDIKDFGHILPGHGGVLDRMDGMILNAVLIFTYMTFLSF